MIDLNNTVSDDDILAEAESIYDSWYAETGRYDGWYAKTGRVDWDNLLDRIGKHTDIDLGCDMMSPGIKAIKRHIAAYRKLG